MTALSCCRLYCRQQLHDITWTLGKICHIVIHACVFAVSMTLSTEGHDGAQSIMCIDDTVEHDKVKLIVCTYEGVYGEWRCSTTHS